MEPAMNDRLFIFDTTLRDGEQSPGASMTRDEKVRIARQLEKLGVDVIEAGFAAASPGAAEAIRTIAETIHNSTVCSLARCCMDCLGMSTCCCSGFATKKWPRRLPPCR